LWRPSAVFGRGPSHFSRHFLCGFGPVCGRGRTMRCGVRPRGFPGLFLLARWTPPRASRAPGGAGPRIGLGAGQGMPANKSGHERR